MWRKMQSLTAYKYCVKRETIRNPVWKSDTVIIIIKKEVILGSYFGLFNLEDDSVQVIY